MHQHLFLPVRNSLDHRADVSSAEIGCSCPLLSVLVATGQGFAADPQTKAVPVAQLHHHQYIKRLILSIAFFPSISSGPDNTTHGHTGMGQSSVQHHGPEGYSSPATCCSIDGPHPPCQPTAARAAALGVLAKAGSEPRLQHALNTHPTNSAQSYSERVFFCAPAVLLLCSKMK